MNKEVGALEIVQQLDEVGEVAGGVLHADDLVNLGDFDNGVSGQVLAGEGGDVVDHQVGVGVLTDFLEVADRLLLRGVAGIEHRRDDGGGAAHLLQTLHVLNDALGAGIHAAGEHRHTAGAFVQRNLNGPVPLGLRQGHAFAVGAADKDAVDAVVDAVVDQLAQAGLVDLFILVNGGDDRRNNTDDFLAHK